VLICCVIEEHVGVSHGKSNGARCNTIAMSSFRSHLCTFIQLLRLWFMPHVMFIILLQPSHYDEGRKLKGSDDPVLKPVVFGFCLSSIKTRKHEVFSRLPV
jgi:hypothetical protein